MDSCPERRERRLPACKSCVDAAFFYEKICAHRKNAEKSEESACSETARVMARCQSDNAGHPVKEKRENDAGG